MADPLPYQRVLLKISGEGLMGPATYGLHNETIVKLARDMKALVEHGQAGLPGHRRGQYLSRPGGRIQRHGPDHRRLYGDAGDGY